MIRTLSLVLSLGLVAPALAEPLTPDVGARLASADRSDADKALDAARRPDEVVAFLGVAPGMTVVDLIAAGGYYTEVMSIAVGPEGKVYAQNTKYVLDLRDGAYDKALTARLADGRLANVERVDRAVADLDLAPGTVDVAFTALNFHDVFNSRGRDSAVAFLRTVRGLLEPGGILGLIDHDGDPAQDNEELHRIPRADVLAAATEAGFELAAEGKMLRNPADDHTRNVFDSTVRRKTDRFVLRLRNPLP